MMDALKNYLVSGESPNDWLLMKFVIAAIGGFVAFKIKNMRLKPGESKVHFFMEGFWFTVISCFGGVFVLAPTTAMNAFMTGLVGWSAIASYMDSNNDGAKNAVYHESALTREELLEIINKKL